MNTIPFKVNKNIIQKIGGYSIASSENNYTKFDFQFSDDWNKVGIQVSATMFFDEDKIPDPVLLTMRNDNTGYCYLPSALKDEHGILKLGLTGAYVDDKNEKIVINTLLTSMPIGQGAFMTKYPANDIYKDMLARIASFDKSKQDRLICKNGITIDKDSNISVDDSVITTDNISRYTTPIEEEISELGKNKLNGKVIAGRVSNTSELLSYEPGIYFAVLNCEDIYPKLEGCIIAITDYDITIYINDEAIILYSAKEELANEEAFKQLNLNKENINQIKNELVTEIELKENISNKVDSIRFPSITSYPSTKAVWDYIDSKLEQPLANISDLKTNKVDNKDFTDYKNTVADKLTSFNIRINDLSMIKENVSNKVNSITNTSNVFYPSCNAIVKYIAEELKEPKEKITALEDSRVTYLDFQTVKNELNTKINDNKSNISDLQENKENVSNKINYIINPSTQNYPNNLAVMNYVKNQLDQPLKDIAQNKSDIIQNTIKVTTDKSTSAAINDSSNKKILGLVMYGNSTQSAEPSPDNPVRIVSNDIQTLKVYKKNIFDMSSCNIFVNDGAKTTLVDRNNNIVKFTTDESKNNSGIYIRHTNFNAIKGYEVDYTKLLNNTVTLSFDITANVDCQIRISFITDNWTRYTSITTNKQRFTVTEQVKDVSKLNNAITFYCKTTNAEITISNVQIEVNSVATDYEKCEYQNAQLEYTLRSANDICDVLTINSDGTGFITERFFYEKLTSGASYSNINWQYSTNSDRFYRDDTRIKNNFGTPNLMCSHFMVKDNEKNKMLDNTIGFTSGAKTAHGIAIRMSRLNGDIPAFKRWLDNNDVYILAPLVEPVVRELSKTEVEKILNLHTYYPSTTVLSDCDSQLTYIADTKNYIDNKFNELAQVIVASADESEVM